jgi:hypothetical protein
MTFTLFAAILGKRTRSIGEHHFILDSKLFNAAPSKMGTLEEYKSLQRDPALRILDDRPVQDLVPPGSLLYDGFGHFLDIFRCREDLHDLTPERRSLELAVDSLAEAMASFYGTEDERRTAGIQGLNEILSLENLSQLYPASVDASSIKSDGHYNGPHNAISCIVEFKKELVNIKSIPLVELLGYVAHSHAEAWKRHPDLYLGWRVPCLGITVVGKRFSGSLVVSDIIYISPGPYIRFYAVILLRQLRVVSLTPALSCVASAGEGDDRKALYAAFSGALDLLRRIDADAPHLLNTPNKSDKTPPLDYRFPYITALPKYVDTSKFLRFRILGLHPDTQSLSNRLLYIAEGLDSKPIVLKFTRC